MFTLTKISNKQLLLFHFLPKHKAIIFNRLEANPCCDMRALKLFKMTVIHDIRAVLPLGEENHKQQSREKKQLHIIVNSYNHFYLD